MHVLYLNHVGQMSGAENSLAALLRQLRRAHSEIETSVALPGSGPFAEQLREEGFSVSFAPLRRITRPDNMLASMTTLMHVLRTAPFVTKLVEKSGATIVHSNSTTAHLVGSLAAQRAGVPAVWHARDLISLNDIAPALAERSKIVIAISNSVKERLILDGVPNEQIQVIYNGLDPDEWRPKPTSQLRETLNLPKDAFVFGCPTQLVPWKNHGEFIEAAGKVIQEQGTGHARFVILGGDLWGEHAEYVTQLRAKVKEHNLIGRFNFVPFQSNGQDALNAFDAIVLPSREEPFGRVLIEGMALQKPVVAIWTNGPREIITPDYNGIPAPPKEETGLAKAMLRLLKEPGLAEEVGRNGRRTVEQRFHIADTAQYITDVYKKVAQ